MSRALVPSLSTGMMLAVVRLLVLFSLLLAVPLHAQTDLFVVAGQSNADGNGANAASLQPDAIDATIPLWWWSSWAGSSNGWTLLAAQKGYFDKGHFGPEIAFARSSAGHGLHPAVFKYTAPGSNLANMWGAPGDGGFYDGMMDALYAAITTLPRRGPIRIRALIWIQGEGDAENDGMSLTYKYRLTRLIDDFRRQVGDPTLPVILGVDEQHPWVRNHPEIVAAHLEAVSTRNCVGFVSMRGLTKADETHLTADGALLHGKLLFFAYEDLVHPERREVAAAGW